MSDGDPLTILLVEDDPTDAALFKALLGHTSAFEQLHAETLRSATDHLSGGEIDLVVLDLGLPDSAIEQTYVRVRDAAPEVPVIVLTGHDDDAAAYQALADGAQDYLVKNDVTETLLAKSIRYSVERQVAIRRSRRQRVEELEVYASLAPEGIGAGSSTLAEVAPDEFGQAVDHYDDLLGVAVEAGYSPTEADLTVQISQLASRLADLKAATSDVGAVHATALGRRQASLTPEQFDLYEDVARLLLLRLTGELANQFRLRAERVAEVEDHGDDGEDDGPLPADARDRLVATLGTLLGEHPLDRITLDELARQAGLPPGAVRSAVAGVHEPLAALVQQDFTRQREALPALLAPVRAAEDPAEGVGALVECLVELWRSGQATTLAAMAAVGDETIQGLRYRHLRELVAAGLDALGDGPKPARTNQLAIAELIALLDQKLALGELFPADLAREEALGELTDGVLQRMSGATPPPRPRPAAAARPTPAEEQEEEAAAAAAAAEAARLTGADYTAWADRMRSRRRSEIDALYEDPEPAALDDKWSPEHLFRDPDNPS
jgi:DNA-binding NarL/FixJ family response regulator